MSKSSTRKNKRRPLPGDALLRARQAGMLVRAPLVEAEQDGSIRIQDLTKVVMVRRRLGLAEERLVPFQATYNVADADDRPRTFHCSSAVGLPSRITCRRKRAQRAVAGRCIRLLGRMLLMLHHVDELAQWIANVEAAHAPRFAPGTVFNWEPCLSDPPQSYLDVVNFD